MTATNESATQQKGRKKIRRAKDPTKSSKLYFHAGTQAAIVAYQQCSDVQKRSAIYTADIAPAFTKLVENLINIHRFTGLHDTHDELRNDCVSFLFESLHKFDATRGSAAFSYFNVVAKNWLVIRSKQRAQKTKKMVSLDEPCGLSANEQRILEERDVVPSHDELVNKDEKRAKIIEVLEQIRERVDGENEITCIDAIITIFARADDIDFINKNATLLYIRELSGLSPKQLTVTMQSLRQHYRSLRLDPQFTFF